VHKTLLFSLTAALICGCAPTRTVPASPAIPSKAAASACSALSITTNGHTVFGANLDYRDHCRGQVFFNPRGLQKTGLIASTGGTYAEWVSRYASLTFNFVGYQYAWGGMNEHGLTMSTMALPQTVYPPADQRPVVDSGFWMQYILDTCRTVEDVIAADAVVRNITVDHYLVADRSGTSVVIEYIGGELVVHTGEELPVSVLTNWFYGRSLDTWLANRGHGNYQRLDGSSQRFCIAADRVSEFEATDHETTIAFAFETLDRIAGHNFSEHASQWSIVFDTENLRAFFRTLGNPEIRYVDLRDFYRYCDTPVQMFDIHNPLSGNVGPAFYDYSAVEVRDHYFWFIDFWETGLSRRWINTLLDHFETFTCDPSRRARRPAGRRNSTAARGDE